MSKAAEQVLGAPEKLKTGFAIIQTAECEFDAVFEYELPLQESSNIVADEQSLAGTHYASFNSVEEARFKKGGAIL